MAQVRLTTMSRGVCHIIGGSFCFRKVCQPWFPLRESNTKPHDYKSCALTNWAKREYMAGTARFELAMTESKSGVLPVTLRPNILLLMEVNLVFSNHPETRKEVLHFYDYSSRGYMLPILHAGDNIWQVLIEPVLRFTDNNGFLNLPLWTLTLISLGNQLSVEFWTPLCCRLWSR